MLFVRAENHLFVVWGVLHRRFNELEGSCHQHTRLVTLQALENLKTVLTQARILGFPREEGQWYFDTEASDVGTRAVLFQIQDGEERVIAYTSKSLEGSEHDELQGYAVSEHRGDTQHDDTGMADE